MRQLTDGCGQLRLLFWRTSHPALRFVCQRQPGRQYRIGPPAPRRTRSSAVKRRRRWRRRWSRIRRVERLSLLRRAHDYHRDLCTRLPAAAVAYPTDRARQLMTNGLISPSPIAAPVRRRYSLATPPLRRPQPSPPPAAAKTQIPRRHSRLVTLPDRPRSPSQRSLTRRPRPKTRKRLGASR